jgi:RNA polymerase sigma-70 factor, ECF subfamily
MRAIAAETREAEIRDRGASERARSDEAPASREPEVDREWSFLRVYDAHVDDVYAFFAYRVGNRADAEDLTQAVFERALGAWHRFDPDRTKPVTWLIAISRNLLVDRHRRDQARPVSFVGDLAALDNEAPTRDGPEDFALGLEPELESALAALGERERELIALRYGANLNAAEIAELVGLSVSNVQQILSRSIRRLRAELE